MLKTIEKFNEFISLKQSHFPKCCQELIRLQTILHTQLIVSVFYRPPLEGCGTPGTAYRNILPLKIFL